MRKPSMHRLRVTSNWPVLVSLWETSPTYTVIPCDRGCGITVLSHDSNVDVYYCDANSYSTTYLKKFILKKTFHTSKWKSATARRQFRVYSALYLPRWLWSVIYTYLFGLPTTTTHWIYPHYYHSNHNYLPTFTKNTYEIMRAMKMKQSFVKIVHMESLDGVEHLEPNF